MKKIIAIILSVLFICFIFVGCSETKEEVSPEDKPYRFVVVDDMAEYDNSGTYIHRSVIYADKETGVMYLMLYGSYRAGITVLLNADGTPMIYDFDKEGDVK